MFPPVLTAIFSLLALVILHEFGHFFFAKRFGVLVEEFGIGLPPRIFGKKIGETLYSLNFLPIGAFVRLYGEEKEAEGSRSFSAKTLWQRSLIVIGGVASFWIVAAVLLSFLFIAGAPTIINDDADSIIRNPHLHVLGVAPASPAESAGLKAGDIIKEVIVGNQRFAVTKVRDIQELALIYGGQEIFLSAQRGRNILSISLIPRTDPPESEGPMGVSLARVGLVTYPWWQAPFRGISATINETIGVMAGWIHILGQLISGQPLPPGVQVSGPVGIFALFNQMSQLGLSYYLKFLATISIYLAIFNILPIPAVDGGKLFFLGLEAVRRKPLSREFEQRITALFFLLLVSLLILVTIKDIHRLILS